MAFVTIFHHQIVVKSLKNSNNSIFTVFINSVSDSVIHTACNVPVFEKIEHEGA